ncbi:MAG: tetratricopeptide repeat protein [Sphingobacteriales bacterium]|nr:tetratricopeptide repeat protein [Sphingobacteriales bacterium]
MKISSYISIFLILTTFMIVSCRDNEKKNNKELIIEKPANALDSALNKLTKKIVRHPDKDELYFQRAKLFQKKGRILLAINDMEKATALQPGIVEYVTYLADLYYEANQIDQAINTYEKSAQLNPNSEYPYLRLGKIYLLRQEYKLSLAYLNRAVEANRFNPEIYSTMSLYFLEMKDTARAIESLKTAVKVNPDFFDAYLDLSYLLANKKDKNLIFYLNNAIRIRPDDVRALYNRGKYFQDIDSFSLAIADYEAILSIDSNHKSACYNLGYIYYLLEKYDLSVRFFTKAIRLKPDYYEAYLGRGLSYAALGNKALARQDLIHIIDHSPAGELPDLARKELLKIN